MKTATTIVSLVGLILVSPTARGAESYEATYQSSVPIHNIKRILRPFVATCDREKTNFRRLFCTALNERLKAQHQAKVYRTEHRVTEVGPLVAQFRARPRPTLDLELRGCLMCKEPLLPRAGGDISKARFFLFKVPKEIKIRRGKNPYDLGEIDVATYTVELPAGTTEKSYKEEILPNLKLELLFRPVAGVTMVGAKRYKYGVINFELVGYEVVHKCTGKVYGVSPARAKPYVVDKNDLSCPQNQPRKAVAVVRLPSTLPQRKVKAMMELVSRDLQACYEQFGVGGRIPTDVVVSSDGTVRQVRVVGKLSGSPTGQCVERLVKNIEFPKFSGEDARIQWPFVLKD